MAGCQGSSAGVAARKEFLAPGGYSFVRNGSNNQLGQLRRRFNLQVFDLLQQGLIADL